MPQHTVLSLHLLWPPRLGSLGYSGLQSLISEGRMAEMAPGNTGVMLIGWGKHPEQAFRMSFELSLLLMGFAI